MVDEKILNDKDPKILCESTRILSQIAVVPKHSSNLLYRNVVAKLCKTMHVLMLFVSTRNKLNLCDDVYTMFWIILMRQDFYTEVLKNANNSDL